MGVRARVAAPDVRSDAELAGDAAGGDAAAFEALYRRYAETAWRVAYAVTGNPDDAADAVADAFTRVLQALPSGRLADASLVRSYLLTATRNAAIDVSRRGGKLQATDKLELLDDGTKISSPTDQLTATEDVSLVARAFRSLPERWRSVLWLVEVEGIPPRDAAALLGVTPNNAAQLAVRARAGLRERFVQAHLSGRVAEECRYTVERLGAYVTGRLAPRDIAKVDQHLAGCEECRARSEQLEDVGGVLRRIVLPLPLLLGPAAVTKWKLASATAATATADAGTKGTAWWTDLATRVQKPLLAATTGIFAVGVIIAAPNVLGAPNGRGGSAGGDRAPLETATQAAPTPAVVDATIRLVSSTPGFTVPESLEEFATTDALPPPQVDTPPQTESTPAPPPSPPTDGGNGDDGTGGDDDGGTGDDAGVVEVGVATIAGPVTAGVVVGDACQGGYIESSSMGCEAPEAEATTLGVTVATDGSSPIGERKVTLGI